MLLVEVNDERKQYCPFPNKGKKYPEQLIKLPSSGVVFDCISRGKTLGTTRNEKERAWLYQKTRIVSSLSLSSVKKSSSEHWASTWLKLMGLDTMMVWKIQRLTLKMK
ncbi:Predicted orf (plasmid) [Photobacterium profundum SS9]|uniref:Predicted orf n=1 Tax=Photobacterium profundum (strain SS9) TaxID=298386 RepID=Q6LWC0_PHOPR|nr:Predicted orf [Photobacterium profundum SS9]